MMRDGVPIVVSKDDVEDDSSQNHSPSQGAIENDHQRIMCRRRKRHSNCRANASDE